MKERKVVFPHYKTLFIRRPNVRSHKLFFQKIKTLWENWLTDVNKHHIKDFAIEILQDYYKKIKFRAIQDMPTIIRVILKYLTDVKITN